MATKSYKPSVSRLLAFLLISVLVSTSVVAAPVLEPKGLADLEERGCIHGACTPEAVPKPPSARAVVAPVLDARGIFGVEERGCIHGACTPEVSTKVVKRAPQPTVHPDGCIHGACTPE